MHFELVFHNKIEKKMEGDEYMTKYIFVTGGVVSGFGKGFTVASLGRLLKARGLKVVAQKLDPYIHVDPGTMNHYQHGEVYVTEDGAKEIHMRISAPSFLHPCYYGTDIDSEEYLIACQHTIAEIVSIIGVDSLGYLPVEALKRLTNSDSYCDACFSGIYPTRVFDTTKCVYESVDTDEILS